MPLTPGRCSGVPVAVLLLAALLGWSAVIGCSARLGGPGDGLMAPVPEGRDCLGAHLAAVHQRQEIGGVAGTGRVQFVSDTGRGRAAFDFVFHRPDVIRLQFISPLGPVAAVLDLDRDRYLFADFREGVFIQGIAGEEDLFRLTGLPVDTRTLISLLLAEPVPEKWGGGRVRFDPETCLPLACELWSLVTPGLPVEVLYRWPGPAPAKGQATECLLLPERVVFTGPGPGRKTTIRFKSVRPLTEAEWTSALEPIDISGLQQAMPHDAAEEHLPRWVR